MDAGSECERTICSEVLGLGGFSDVLMCKHHLYTEVILNKSIVVEVE